MRFLFGQDTTKKNERLLSLVREVLDEGHEAILLVPEQETVTLERRMVEALPPQAQLSFEVSNFSRLANRIFRTVGGLSYRYATPGATALVMWRTLCKVAPMLTQYAAHAATDLHLTEQMLGAVMQFKAYAITPEQLTTAAEALPEHDPLSQKLKDLALVYATYVADLGERYDDTADDIARATKLILANRAVLAKTHIFISSFTDFTAAEIGLIHALLDVCPEVTVLSPLSDLRETGIHLASASATCHKLIALSKKADKPVFFEAVPPDPPKTALDFVRRDLFALHAEPAPMALAETGDVRLTVCANPYEEAEYAATLIARAVREGARYRDFTVVVRDVTAYAGILDAALEKENIPYYLSEKTDVTVRPLIKLLQFALRIGRYGWQKEDVVGYLKTGLVGVCPDDVNFFEEYAEVWHVSGKSTFATPFTMNPDGYSERTSARATRILAGANRAREALVPPLNAYLGALDGHFTAEAAAKATYDFLLALGVPEAMKARAAARLAAGERRDAEEQTRLFSVVVDALETAARALGTHELDLAAFADVLSLLFTATDIGVIPTSCDEVMIGSAETLRAAPTENVLVLGLCDGLFPKTVTDKGLLSDAEKRRLADLDIHLSADLATSASDELFYLYRAFTLPERRLYLSYVRSATDGRHTEPSIGISRILALFPAMREVDYAALPPLEKIYSRAGALEHWRELDRDARKAVLTLLQETPDTAEKITNLQKPVTDRDAFVSPEIADKLFDQNAFNPTGLEKFVSCKFAYYCDKILHLRAEPNDSLDAAAIGTFIHYVLENTLKEITESGRDFAAYTEAQTDTVVEKSLLAYRAYLTEAGGGISPRAEVLLTRLSSLARIVVGALVAEFADSSFSPAFFELDLRRFGGASEVTLTDGSTIPLSGKADRVDLYRAENGEAYLRVADYKTGRKSFCREDISKGFCLQMPLYLFALCKNQSTALSKELGLDGDTPIKPAGVTYLSTAIGNDDTAHRIGHDEAVASAASRLRREGLLPDSKELLTAISHSHSTSILGSTKTRKARLTSEAEFESLFAELTDTVARIGNEMKSGSATVAPTDHNGQSACAYCPYGAVCRGAEKA